MIPVRTLLAFLVLELLARDLTSCTQPPPVKDAGQCVVIVVAGVDAGPAPDAGVDRYPGF